jgi:colanic acid biosynthesis glycosyl transferase WcaI
MKIGIVSQWFEPEPGPAALPAQLAKELQRRGHEVRVVTAFPNYPFGDVYEGYRQRLHFQEDMDGVQVNRVPIYASHDDSSLRRMINYLSFGLSSAWLGDSQLRDCDVVWISNSPPSIALFVARLKRHGVPCVLHVMDLWPDNIESSALAPNGITTRLMIKGVHWTNSYLFSAVDAVLTIAPQVNRLLEERGAPARRISYAPLWANDTAATKREGTLPTLRQELGVNDETIVLLYAGTIGHAQDLEVLMQALSQLRFVHPNQLECWIIGDGVWQAGLENHIAEMPKESPRTRYFGRKEAAEMPAWLAASDVCFVGLKRDQHARFSMPSKVQTILCAGKPILTSAHGSVTELISSLEVGFSSNGGTAEALTEELNRVVECGRPGLAVLGDRARLAYLDHFSVCAGIDRIEGVLLDVARHQEDAEMNGIVPATAKDITSIVRIHQASFPNFFLSFLGPRFLTLLYEDLEASPDAVLLVAKVNGNPVGFVAGVENEQEYFSRLFATKRLSFAIASLPSLVRRPSIAGRLLRARRRGETSRISTTNASLLSIGVDPLSHRGGFGSSLVTAFTETMATRGIDTYSLTTDAAGNAPALSFYASLGIDVSSRYSTPDGRKMLELTYRPAEGRQR